jgi:signal transduction histidine kinase/Tfp pilus assembly protein PilF
MMKTNFQLILLLLAVGCNAPGNSDKAPVETAAIVVDSLFVPSGDAELDSLLQLAAVARQDTNLARLYYDIGEIYLFTDSEKATEYYFKLRALSKSLNWSEGKYLFAGGYTDVLNREGLVDSSIVVHREALELAKREMNERRIAMISVNIGNCYNLKRWFETALNYYHDALSIFERSGEKNRLAYTYSMMTTVYTEMDMQDEGLLYSEKALKLFDENPDSIERMFALINYAVALFRKQEIEQSENCLLEAQRICILHGYRYQLVKIYNNRGTIAMQQHDWDKAEMYNRKSLAIAEEFDDVMSCCISNYGLGYIEMCRGNLNRSEDYVRKALSSALAYEFPSEKMKCYELLSYLSAGRQRFGDVQHYAAKADSIQQTIVSESTVRAAKEMEAKYETAKKEFEIERQQGIISRQHTMRNLFVVSVVVLVVFLGLLWYMLCLRIRRNRALVERNDALGEINTTKDKFFNIISHDLRNPAVAQRDALRVLVTDAPSWDAVRLADYHAELLKVAEEQAELIYNLLGWGQLQTGRIVYTPFVFNLSARLRSDIRLLRDMANYKGVSLLAEMPDSVLVLGDVNMLSGVVRNLLGNAIKFTAEGGVVTLEVSPVAPVSPKYIVSVVDTGVGMSEEQVETLRATTLQSHQGTAGEQGTGLGLIVCKEFLEKHGSMLHVESELGKGSRFWFEI